MSGGLWLSHDSTFARCAAEVFGSWFIHFYPLLVDANTVVDPTHIHRLLTKFERIHRFEGIGHGRRDTNH